MSEQREPFDNARDAVCDALRDRGVTITTLPLTAREVHDAIERSKP